MKRIIQIISLALIVFAQSATVQADKPLMKNFMGINGHYTFKPELYKQVCRLVRNYHDMNWDVEKPGDAPTFPVCVNKVNWKDHVYGKWTAQGFEIDICSQFVQFGRKHPDHQALWKGHEEWAYQYGYEMAKYFGPTSGEGLCTSIEIGNEPGKGFYDPLYQQVFKNMARGIRDGDPALKIVTCTVHDRKADDYSKSLSETFADDDLISLFDVINLHTYALVPKEKAANPWQRSYPEDAGIDYLKVIDKAVAWRDREAPGKQIWITEFGWDACTDEAILHREGWFEKLNWTDVSDLQQAQYIVRSFLVFSAMDIERAYLYFYNDDDKPSVHAASGITRKFQPKPSFWAMKHLYETLGGYRFNRVVQQDDNAYVYEYKHGAKDGAYIWAVWSPTGSGVEKEITLTDFPSAVSKIEAMPTAEGDVKLIDREPDESGKLTLPISESPVYIIMNGR
ncbi:hypothetical protein K8I31_10295 [bacterium]|nr:hypothetical protein [bacterium]